MGPELYAIRKDGQEFPLEISLSPLETEEGTYVTAAIHDISERKRAEGRIHKLSLELQAKEQLQLLLDSTAEAIYAIDVNGACTLCNAACLRLLGYSRDSELLAKNMHALMHHTRPDGRAYSEDSTSIRELLATALAEPAIVRTVQDLKRKFTDTDSTWVEMILDEMSLHGEERDREAPFVVHTMRRVVKNHKLVAMEQKLSAGSAVHFSFF